MFTHEQWERLLTPEAMRERLISASLYVTAFQLLKESIIGRLRTLFSSGFDTQGHNSIVSDKYKDTVLSRNASPLYASLDWLVEKDAIDQGDLEVFDRLKNSRNSLAHDLPRHVMCESDFKVTERFTELVALLRKIEVWWIVNLELPANQDFDNKEVNEEEIVPGPVLMLQMMLEILSGNEELLKHFKGTSK